MISFRSILRSSKPRRGAWACIITGLALAAIWWVSLGSSIYTGVHTLGIGIHSGAVILVAFDDPPARMHGAHWIWPNWNLIRLPEWERNPANTHLTLPFWPLILALLAYGLLRLYRLRDIPTHLCANCHYDRRGLPPNSPCPECGTLSQPRNTQT